MNRAIIILVLCIALAGGGAVTGIVIYRSMTGTTESKHMLSVDKIEKMGKLELVKVNIKDVIEQTSERPFYLPIAKAVLIISGEVFAGLDLEKVEAEDIVDTDNQLAITLPKPEILTSKLNHEKSKVYDVEWGGFSTANLADEAYKDAELTIIEEAEKAGYEKSCKNNTRALLTPIFRELSGKEVEISFKK